MPLERQHLVAFAERYYGGTLHTVRLHPLRGGLQAAGVLRVDAQLRSPRDRLRPAQFVVKCIHSELHREWAVYRTLEAHGAEAIAPRLLDVIHLGVTTLLFLEWVRRSVPGPGVTSTPPDRCSYVWRGCTSGGGRQALRRACCERMTMPCTSLHRRRWRRSNRWSMSRVRRSGRPPCQ